jgi:tetratricopeptide (TPR) repeat protein
VKTRDRIRLKQIERQSEGLLELGLVQQALDNLARLGSLVDSSPRALYLQGEALRTLDRCEEALTPLVKAAQATPRDIHVWLALAWCRKRTSRIDLAIAAMERALRAKPSEALVHYNMACYLSLAGQKPRAIDHLSKALALDEEFRALVERERDFDPIRSDPEFQALTNISV